MNYIAIEQEKFNLLQGKVDEMYTILKMFTPENINELIPGEEIRKKLKVSRRTWYKIRKSREISFVQRGRAVYVFKNDLETYLKRHHINALVA